MKTQLKSWLLVISVAVSLATQLHAQDLSGLSICLDPGHGQGNANQGPTGLREADINLDVSFFLKDFLKSAHIDTVLLTRVDDSTNPSLSQREALANSFGVDWFHSVHHNACGSIGTVCTARRTLVLIEEERTSVNRCPNGSRRGTGVPEWPGEADVMSDLMAERIFQAFRTTSRRVRLDWTFYGGCDGGFSLGVLNDLQMPGQLSEATFHQTLIEENKLQNPDFLRLEARALFMAILDFYEAGTLPTGILAGIVRDEETGEPVNGAVVTLTPGELTYTTDNNNNGLYVFHDLAPGTYEVSASAPNLASESGSAQVFAHAFRFRDFSLESGLPPVITATLPQDQSQNVDVYEEIGVRFSRAMSRERVEAAFSITPSTPGHFIWNNSDDVIFFEPDVRFEFDTAYGVEIASTAVDVDGQPLDGNGDGTGGDPFAYSFTTMALDNSSPVVLDFFPIQRDTAVFVRDVYWAQFNQELDPPSVNQTSVKLAITGASEPDLRIDYVQDGSRRVTLVPKQPLAAGQRYFLTFTTEVALQNGESLDRSFVRQFTTQSTPLQIAFLDDFEAGLNWTQPQDSPNTVGTNPDGTSFNLTQDVFISGGTGSELHYELTGQIGFIQLDNLGEINLALDDEPDLGLYVYGDSSKNQIRLFFDDLDGAEALPWTTIDWSGWRLLRFNLNETSLEAGQNGNGQFDAQEILLGGIQLNIDSMSEGRLFIEDLILVTPEAPVSVTSPEPSSPQPKVFTLSQNYPNPFNPETQISYQILANPSATSRVLLEVYNLQGQKVRTLVDARQPSGVYSVVWDGRDDLERLVSSGVYAYQLRIGSQTESKKMVLLK